MDVRLTDDTEAFAHAAESFVRCEPFTSNVISVQVDRVLRFGYPMLPGYTWVLAEDTRGVVGIAMHTPPHPLFLPRLGKSVAEAIASTLADADRMLPGVNGETRTVKHFARSWKSRTGQRSRLRAAMRLYVLGDLRPPEFVEATPRRAGPADVDLVTSWYREFHDEATPGSAVDDLRAPSERLVTEGAIWIWKNGDEPVALAIVRAALGVAALGPSTRLRRSVAGGMARRLRLRLDIPRPQLVKRPR